MLSDFESHTQSDWGRKLSKKSNSLEGECSMPVQTYAVSVSFTLMQLLTSVLPQSYNLRKRPHSRQITNRCSYL